MKKIIISLVAIFVVMEGLGWWIYKSSKKEDSVAVNASSQIAVSTQKSEPDKNIPKSENSITAPKENINDNQSISDGVISGGDVASFPPPSVEKIDGVIQRTIHMGVRQWAWDPSELNVNYGEKVILIMHNADVPHSISIPELNVRENIPEEGAVVMFVADKRGTFDFFCAVPCGSGHNKMQGKITVS